MLVKGLFKKEIYKEKKNMRIFFFDILRMLYASLGICEVP